MTRHRLSVNVTGQCYPFPKQRTALGIPHFPSAAKPFWKSNRRPLFWTVIPSHFPLFSWSIPLCSPRKATSERAQHSGSRASTGLVNWSAMPHIPARPTKTPPRPVQTLADSSQNLPVSRSMPEPDRGAPRPNCLVRGDVWNQPGRQWRNLLRATARCDSTTATTDFPSWPSEPSSPVSAPVSAPWTPLCRPRCPRCLPCPSTLARRQFHMDADYCYPARVWRCSIRRPAGSKDHANAAMAPSRPAVSPGSEPWRPNIACSGGSVPGPGYMGR